MKNRSFVDVTVDRIISFYQEKKCYLLADETGLGKTIASRELINKWYQNKPGKLKVLYIAPNLVLAEKNIKKLKHKNLTDKTEIIDGDRMTLGVLEKEKDKEIKYWAITPAVSFFLEGGTDKERQILFQNNQILLSDQSATMIDIQNKIESIEKAYKKASGQSEAIKPEAALLSDDAKELYEALRERNEGFLFSLVLDYESDKKKLIEMIVKNAFTRRKASVIQYRSAEWLEDAFIHYINRNEQKEIKLQNVLAKIKKDNVSSWKWYSFRNVTAYDWKEFPEFFDAINKKKDYLCENKLLLDEIKRNQKKGGELIDGSKVTEHLVKIINQEGTKEDWEIAIAWEQLITAFAMVHVLYWKKDDVDLAKDLQEALSNDLMDVMYENKTAKTKELNEILKEILKYTYWQLAFYYRRLAACIYNVKQWSPDLVIFDEFQNYPNIFSGSKSLDSDGETVAEFEKSTQNVQKILEAVSETGKILMLSATPYSYHNLISAGVSVGNEEEQFLNHVGMEDILRYMEEQNGIHVDHSDLFMQYHECVDEFVEVFDIMGETERSERYKELCEKAKMISDTLYAAGISRNERPTTDYDLKGEALYVSPQKVAKQSTDMCTTIDSDDDDPFIARRFLSLPFYVSGAGELLYRVRTKELLRDIFPEKEGFIPPIFMPATLSQNIQGPFVALRELDYAKLISFSRYTSVPPLQAQVVNAKLEELLQEVETIDTSGDQKVFDDYLKNILDRLSIKYPKIQMAEMPEVIKSKFAAETSSKIIAKSITQYCTQDDMEVNPKNYWECVKIYCEWGDFEAVLDEYFFLYMEENENKIVKSKNKQKEEEKLNPAQVLKEGMDTNFYAVAYTSKSQGGKGFIEHKIDLFQSPFYPFCFFLSSVAQEGLDFHWYCDRIVHWNVPSSPIAMLQREGRINRYRCLSLRKQLAKELREKYLEEFECSVHSIEELFDFANKKIDAYQGQNGFYPDHLSLSNEPLPLKRKCYYYPLSEEYFRWKDLIVNMEFYRSLFGGWGSSDRISDEMLEYCREQEKKGNGSIMIDLSPLTR